MDRGKAALAVALVAGILVVGAHVALFGRAMVCEANGCHRPGPPVAVESALTLAGVAAFALVGFLAVRAFRPSAFAFGCTLAALLSAGVLVAAFAAGGGPSGCSGGPQGMSCYESPAAWVRTLVQGALLSLGASIVGALVGRLFATTPGTPARARALRVAILALAACFVVPALLSLRVAPAVPDGVEWQLEGRQLCARWSYANGLSSGESCRALSGLIVAPIALVAGAGAALQAGRPAWRWPGSLAIALGVAAVGVIVALNFGSATRTTWYGMAALTAALALACWLLDRERTKA